MLLIIILIICIVVGIPFLRSWEYDWIGFLLTVCGGIFLFTILLTIPITRYQVQAGLREFEATKQTIQIARENNNELEKAAIQHKIIECNQWLAEHKYYNEIFDLWIPDEVMELSPMN